MSPEDGEGQRHCVVDERLLSLLVCPACHESVEPRQALIVCRGCGLGYPVRDGIPLMLLSEATRQERGETGPAGNGSCEPGERNDRS